MADSRLAEADALFVFCEGPHDIAFVAMVLRHVFGFAPARDSNGNAPTFSQYPAPLNNLFQNNVIKHAQRDLSLDMAHKFFLPDMMLQHGSRYVLLFHAGGKDNHQPVQTFLSQFLTLWPNAADFPEQAPSLLRHIAFLFTYDADDQGVTATIQTMAQAFSRIDGIEENLWLLPELVPPANAHGAFSGNQGFYVWAGPDGKGTLEDLLIPLFQQRNADLFRNAAQAMDTLFTWSLKEKDNSPNIAQQSKRAKAILTTMGQKKKPGGSLNVVLRQAKLVRAEDLRKSDEVKAFSDFLRRFAGTIVIPNEETPAG